MDRTTAEAWAARVDSETLAAGLSCPMHSETYKAARAEWDRREAAAKAQWPEEWPEEETTS